jgi:hypothetical protein
MNAVSKATDKNEIRDPDLSKVNISQRFLITSSPLKK